MKIRFWNIKDLGGVVYDTGAGYFNQTLDLPGVEDLKNEYEILEDGSTKDGKFIAKEVISNKIHKLTLRIPEYLCDVLNTLRQHDKVFIEFDSGYIEQAIDVTFELKKELENGLKEVELSFVFEYVVKNNRDSNFVRS